MQNSGERPMATVLAQRLRDARDELTRRWLDRIRDRATLDPSRIFPTEDLLDHIPRLIEGIADYLENPVEELTADALVVAKAMELGEMRRAQGFGAHEVLKEYELLGSLLFSFVLRSNESAEGERCSGEALECGQRLFQAISAVQQVTTVGYVRVAREEVNEREERLRSFNRMVTHELKNRITAVRGAADMLREPWVEEDAAERKRFLSIVHRNAERMGDTLESLVGLIHTRSDSRQERNVELPAVVAESARQLRDMAEERDVEIRIATDIPPVEVDAAAVELCLVNYISNAIKYSDPSKPERWVEVRAYWHGAGDDAEVVVEVRDNGKLLHRCFRGLKLESWRV
jgi:signal transduction histidine kinase